MRKVLLVLAAVLIGVCTVSSQTFDPGYISAFGEGVIIASTGGYPKFDSYNPDQFIYKNGLFFVKNDEQSTLDFRVIFPKGMTEGKLIEKLNKDKPQNLKHKKAQYALWQLWISHDPDGRPLFTERAPWPKKLSDEPMWSAPVTEEYFNAGEESKNWTTSGWEWGGKVKSAVSNFLNRAKPGYKIYVIYRVCYEYSVPGGQIENKWDMNLKKFVPTKSTGGIGYVESDPIAACTIEIYADEISADRFKDNSDGTVTDTKTGLMWEKAPYKKELNYKEAEQFTSECRVGNYSDWRLPDVNELKEMMKISKAKDKEYSCEWLNQNGFQGIQESSYWTSSGYVLNGQETDDKMCVDFRYKTVGGSGILYMRNIWLVRSAK